MLVEISSTVVVVVLVCMVLVLLGATLECARIALVASLALLGAAVRAAGAVVLVVAMSALLVVFLTR